MTTVEFEFSEHLDNTRFHCGIDVYKHQITVAIIGRDDAGYEKVVQEVFATTKTGLSHFWGFARKYKPLTFSMEATNVYHHVLVTFLNDRKNDSGWPFTIIIANPSDASGIPGRQKNDKVDSKDLARYAAAGLLKSGHAINVPLEDMRALFRSAYQVEKDRTRLKNRIKKSLDRGGFRPVGFDFNSNWTRDFTYHLTNHDGTVGEFYSTCMTKNSPIPAHVTILARNEAKLKPFFDVRLSPGQQALVRQDLVELEFKTTRKAMLSVEIDRIICTRPGLRQKIHNLATIPGISPYTAAWLVAESGDIGRFSDVKKFLAFCGCCPRVKSTDKKVFSCHVTRKSNKHVRTMLFAAAKVLCIATKQQSALKTYATRVLAAKRHRGMKLPFTIIASKIARIVYAIIRDNVAFSPDLARCRGPAPARDAGPFTVTDRKLIRRARNLLSRVGTMEHLKIIARNAAYFADALDKALQENN
jgi:transposase